MTGTCSPHCLLIFQSPLGFGSRATYSLFMEVNEAVCSLREGQQNIQRAKKNKTKKHYFHLLCIFSGAKQKKLFILIKRCCKWTIMNDKMVKDSTFCSKDIITSDWIACELFSVIRLQCTSDLVLNTIHGWMIIPTLKSNKRFSKEAVNS